MIAAAQMKEGKVIYERTIQMQFRPRNINPEMADNLPRERKEKFELSFSSRHSLWESAVEIDAEEETTGSGPNRSFVRFGGNNDIVYHDFETGRRIDQRELNSKNFIVEDSIQKLTWKLTGETKTILGHTVQKAAAERLGTRSIMAMENGEMKRQQVADTTVIIAWYAPGIPVPAGPEFQGQLPGLILELDMNNGRIVYKALELSAKVNVATIKAPKSGKKVTAAAFNKEREKMFEEMRRNMPPGMQVRIAE
jgi:GLPGLI family protein